MREKCFQMGVVATVAAAFAIVGVFGVTAADDPAHATGPDFLAKATVALNAVQAKVKDDKILGPLTKAKIEQGEGYLTIHIETPESWLNFPSKPHNLARGYGWLKIVVYGELPKESLGTPFIPPPGCYPGSTFLIVSDTQAMVSVETTTSDSGAQRRLVNLVEKELGNAGITIRARPNKPDEVDSFPQPGPAPRPPSITAPAGPPSAQPSPERS